MKELVVISPLNDWTCRECQDTGDLLVMEGPGPLCLACAELDHLVFLGRGDAALTRRAKAASIARHATVRSSGRVGRTAAAKELEERPLVLAVVAAVRHGHTRYDELLMSGMDRGEARAMVRSEVDRILAEWRGAD